MTRVAIAALATAALSGCGTMGNLAGCCVSGPHEIYGGVRLDAKAAWESGGEAVHTKGLESLGHVAEAVCFLALDLPLSAVADTVTLPITIPTAIEKKLAKGSHEDLEKSRTWEQSDRSDSPSAKR